MSRKEHIFISDSANNWCTRKKNKKKETMTLEDKQTIISLQTIAHRVSSTLTNFRTYKSIIIFIYYNNLYIKILIYRVL